MSQEKHMDWFFRHPYYAFNPQTSTIGQCVYLEMITEVVLEFTNPTEMEHLSEELSLEG